MKNAFIESIGIDILDGERALEINLFREETRHLIFTGDSGSGKTRVLKLIEAFLNSLEDEEYESVINLHTDIREDKKKLKFLRDEAILTEKSKREIIELKNNIEYNNRKLGKYYDNIEIKMGNSDLLQERFLKKEFCFKFIQENRDGEEEFNKLILTLRELKKKSLESIESEKKNEFKKFLKEINLLIENIFIEKTIEIRDFEEEEVKVIVNGKVYENKDIPMGIKRVIGMFFSIYNLKNVNGIVLIDSIEEGLSIKMQKSIVNKLINKFKNIQFIIATQSPFIVTATYKTCVCDLENGNISRNGLSTCSCSLLISEYYDIDKYSNEARQMLKEYRNLVIEGKPSRKIEKYFENINDSFSPELKYEFNSIKIFKEGNRLCNTNNRLEYINYNAINKAVFEDIRKFQNTILNYFEEKKKNNIEKEKEILEIIKDEVKNRNSFAIFKKDIIKSVPYLKEII